MESSFSSQITDAQVDAAFKENVIKFPKIERLPIDPPIAGQNFGLFSFRFLPKPVNGVYGFLKFRGAFATEGDWEKHAKNIIRNVDSKHHIWPYGQGTWFPITTNEEFAKETLEVGKEDELRSIFNSQEKEEETAAKSKVKEIKNRETKLREECKKKYTDTESLDYFAQKVMTQMQLESWLETMRKRKRDLLKALKSTKDEISRMKESHPEYLDKVDDKIKEIKEEIGLEADAPIDKPSLSMTK